MSVKRCSNGSASSCCALGCPGTSFSNQGCEYVRVPKRPAARKSKPSNKTPSASQNDLHYDVTTRDAATRAGRKELLRWGCRPLVQRAAPPRRGLPVLPQSVPSSASWRRPLEFLHRLSCARFACFPPCRHLPDHHHCLEQLLAEALFFNRPSSMALCSVFGKTSSSRAMAGTPRPASSSACAFRRISGVNRRPWRGA